MARLAADASFKRQGLGRFLLLDVLRLTASTAERIGIRCIVVDAIDDNAAAFYQHYGFEPLTTDPKRLALHPQTVRAALQDGGCGAAHEKRSAST